MSAGRDEWLESGNNELTSGLILLDLSTGRSENEDERLATWTLSLKLEDPEDTRGRSRTSRSGFSTVHKSGAFRQGGTYSLVYPSAWPCRPRRSRKRHVAGVEGATLSIAWRTDYAIRLVYELARLGPGARASIGIVAEDAGVPYDFARQIANRLARRGVLSSRRGSHGGFALARSAEELSLLDVFEAMGEKPTMSLCTHDAGACSRTSRCPVHNGVWRPLDDVIRAQLSSMTMADAVAAGRSV